MSGIVDWLSGAGQSANGVSSKVGDIYNQRSGFTNDAYNSAGAGLQAAYANALPGVQQAYLAGAAPTGQLFQNAADASNRNYSDAEGKLISATGSPAAAQFAALQAQGLQPAFKQQQDALAGQLASQGIGTSGAGAAAYGSLAANQASSLAQADAPLYANAESQYGNLLGAGAGAYSSLLGQGASAEGNQLGTAATATGNFIGQGVNAYGNLLGAQANAQAGIQGSAAGAQGTAYTNTYNQSIADFYSALQAAGSDIAGVPGGSSSPYAATQGTPYNVPASPSAAYDPTAFTPTSVQAPGPSGTAQLNAAPSLSGAASYQAPAYQAPNYNPYSAA
jgi:hypothetical protein